MDDDVRSLRILDEPFVGDRITAEHETEPIPVEAIADGSVENVNGRERRDPHAVLLVDDFVVLLVVELVGNHPTTGVRPSA